MFKLVGVQGVLFAVLDTDDNSIDILSKGKVCKCLNLGIEIGGIEKISNSEFSYTTEFFPSDTDDSDEEDYDDGYDDDYGDDYDDSEESYDDYEEDDEDNEEDDEYDDYSLDEDDEYDDAFDDGFGDEDYGEEDEDVSTVNKLYSHLNDEQIKLLKRYYLWFSQRIFDEGRQKARTLKVTSNPRKLQKQKELNAMRNQGGMWAYAGYIDMGYRGADHCTLGHALRNVHLAWDISVSDIETAFFGESYDKDIEEVIESNNCIKFGIDCISDFFEIDKEYTDKLKKAQREAIKDMDFMCNFYESGLQDDVISSFTVMDEIMKYVAKADTKGSMLFTKDYKYLVNKGLTSFYLQFRKLNMVVPKSLIQEIRDNLIGWETHKFIGWKYPNYKVLGNVISSTLGKSTKDLVDSINSHTSWGYVVVLRDFLIDFFQLKSCGYYEYNADTFKDEGGGSKPLKSQLYAIHNNILKNFWSDAEYTFDFIKKLSELNSLAVSCASFESSLSTPTLSFSHHDNRWYIDYDNIQLDYSCLRAFSDEHNIDLYELYYDVKDFSRLSNRICKDGNNCKSLNDYLVIIKDKVDSLSSYADSYNEFVTNKLNNDLNTRNQDIISKEEERLKREQEEELRLQEEKKKKEEEQNNKLTDEEIRQYCIDNAKSVKNPKLKFALTVLDTVKKTGKCSDKQMYYINQVYTELTGVQLEDKRQNSKVSLDDRKDIEDAIDKVLADPDLLENTENKEKVYAILTSIKKYRSISDRQMKYAEIALDLV